MASIRTFIAIELTAEALAALEQVQSQLRRSEGGAAGRWVSRESIHLTLKFLGDVPSERLEEIYQAVARAAAAHAPFVLSVAGAACFPNPQRPRVIWAGVREETGRLLALQRAVERELQRLGFPKEERPFTPHLTLARIREGADPRLVAALGQAVAQSQVGEVAQMQVERVSVMRSDLQPSGAVYHELYTTPLGGAQG